MPLERVPIIYTFYYNNNNNNDNDNETIFKIDIIFLLEDLMKIINRSPVTHWAKTYHAQNKPIPFNVQILNVTKNAHLHII